MFSLIELKFSVGAQETIYRLVMINKSFETYFPFLIFWDKKDSDNSHNKTKIHDLPGPIYHDPRYNVPLCVPQISCFTNVLTFPRFTVPPIYHAFSLSPKKHSKSGDYCTINIQRNNRFRETINSFIDLDLAG